MTRPELRNTCFFVIISLLGLIWLGNRLAAPGPLVFHLDSYYEQQDAYEPGMGPALSVYVVGDTGSGDHRLRKTADAMAGAAALVPADMVVMLGDKAYPRGIESAHDPQWRTAFTEPFDHPSLAVPFFPVLGNHDYSGKPEAQVGWSQDERWNLPAKYHALERTVGESHRVLFVFLDTNDLLFHGREARMRQMAWLEETLARSKADWKLVVGHQPIVSGGVHGTNAKAKKWLLPVLLAGGVDAYLAGHDHHQAWMLPPGGVPQLISGAGSKPRSVKWTEETVAAHVGLGFARLRIEAKHMWIQFLASDTGSVLTSHRLDAQRATEASIASDPPGDRPAIDALPGRGSSGH